MPKPPALRPIPLLQQGMTLVELLVATTLLSILLVTVSSMFMTFVTSSAKTSVKESVIFEGNYAMGQLEFMIRNAMELIAPSGGSVACQTGMSQIALISQDGYITQFEARNNKIASRAASPSDPNSFTDYYLTSDDVQITSGPTFDCYQDGEARFVTVDFTLRRTNVTGSFGTEHFANTIQVRNYY